MRTRRLFGTLGSLFLFLLVLCAEPGRAAEDSAVITAVRDGDVRALRALIAKTCQRERAGARRFHRIAPRPLTTPISR